MKTTMRVLISAILLAQCVISIGLWSKGLYRPAAGWLLISLACTAIVFIGTS